MFQWLNDRRPAILSSVTSYFVWVSMCANFTWHLLVDRNLINFPNATTEYQHFPNHPNIMLSSSSSASSSFFHLPRLLCLAPTDCIKLYHHYQAIILFSFVGSFISKWKWIKYYAKKKNEILNRKCWVFDAFEFSESMFSSVLSHFILKYRPNGWRVQDALCGEREWIDPLKCVSSSERQLVNE